MSHDMINGDVFLTLRNVSRLCEPIRNMTFDLYLLSQQLEAKRLNRKWNNKNKKEETRGKVKYVSVQLRHIFGPLNFRFCDVNCHILSVKH